jgi:hypothetical protein
MAILDSFGKEAKTLRVAKVFSTISMDDQALRLQLLNTRKAERALHYGAQKCFLIKLKFNFKLVYNPGSF